MMGGGGGGGGTPQVFQPPGQEGVAGAMGRIAGPLTDIAANGGINTPAGVNYPTGQNFVNEFLTGQGGGAAGYGERQRLAFEPTYQAAQYAQDTLYPRGTAQGDVLAQLGMGGVPYATQALTQGFDPGYGLGTPEFAQALGGAQQGATMGGAGADQMFANAGQIGGTVNPLIQSGFDPQAALFNRSRQQLMDQTGAVNAMSGLGGTPYGASVMSNALGNFDINWENQQLARQAQAAQAAGQAGTTAGNLYGAAPGLAAGSAALPNAAILQQLAARNQGAQQGLTGYGSGLQSVGSAFGGAQNAGTQAAQTAMQLGAAPYNLGQGLASNALSGLNSATNLGNQQYALPMQLLQSFQNYLTGGQSAALGQGQLQNQQFNQQAQGIGGLLSGLGTIGNLAMAAPAAGSMAASV